MKANRDYTPTEEKPTERPSDCACWDQEAALACWPCARAGFSTQNPAEPRAHTEEGR